MGRRRLAGMLVAVVLGAWVLPALPAMAEPVPDPVEVTTADATPTPTPEPGTDAVDALPAGSGTTPSPAVVPEEDAAGDAEPDLAPGLSAPLPDPSGPAEDAVSEDGLTDEEPVEEAVGDDEVGDDPEAPLDGVAAEEGPAATEELPGPEAEPAEDEVELLAVGDVTLEIVSATCIGAGLVPSATVTVAVGNAGQSDLVDFTVTLVGTGSDDQPVVITSATGSVATGETEELALRYVNPGSYQVEVVVEGEDGPSASTPVQTALCLVVESSCDSITFGNAEGNPPVLLSYTDVYSDSRPVEVELAPGESLTLTDVGASWTAVSSLDQVVRAGQGFAEPTFDVCEPLLGSIASYCADVDAPVGSLEFDAFFPVDRDPGALSWRVLAAGTGATVAEGPFETEFEDEFGDDVEDPGYGFAIVAGLAVGDYQVVLLDGTDVVEVRDADVLTCLGVSAVCDDVTLTNPSTNPTVTGFYITAEGLEDEDGGGEELGPEFDLAPGETRTDTIESSDDLVLVLAVDAANLDFDDEDGFDFSFDFAAFQEVELGLGCDPATGPGQEQPTDQDDQPAAPVSGDQPPAAPEQAAVSVPVPVTTTVGGSLAATGGPVGIWALLGVLSLLAGSGLLVGRRLATARLR